MGFKMTKAQIAERDALIGAVESALSDQREAASDYNAALKLAHGKLCDAVNESNAAIANLRDWLTSAAEEARNEWDDRSEKWQEGDAGQSANEWIEKVEAAGERDDIDEPPTPDDADETVIDDTESWLDECRDTDEA